MTDSENLILEEPEFKEILTTRLRLRTVRVADAEILMQIGLITRWDVMKWTSHGPVSTLEQARKWMSTRSLGKDVFNFVVELRQQHETDESAQPQVIGLAGSFHPPEVGYMIHPSFAGHGYATEAIQAIIAEMWTRFPPAGEGGTGFDHVEGCININNLASKRILEKCGFSYCETEPDPDNQMLGPSETLIFRRARPGKNLEDLGLLTKRGSRSEADPPTPPVE